MSNLAMYDIPAIHVTNADTRKLREDNDMPASVMELRAETLGASGKRLRKHSLSHGGNQARSLSRLEDSESINDHTSSMNHPPNSSPYFSLPDQYPTKEVGTVRMQNPDAFQVRQQTQSFGNLQFDPNLTLYTNSPVPLVFGDSFVTGFDQPGMLFNGYLTNEQISSGLVGGKRYHLWNVLSLSVNTH